MVCINSFVSISGTSLACFPTSLRFQGRVIKWVICLNLHRTICFSVSLSSVCCHIIPFNPFHRGSLPSSIYMYWSCSNNCGAQYKLWTSFDESLGSFSTSIDFFASYSNPLLVHLWNSFDTLRFQGRVIKWVISLNSYLAICSLSTIVKQTREREEREQMARCKFLYDFLLRFESWSDSFFETGHLVIVLSINTFNFKRFCAGLLGHSTSNLIELGFDLINRLLSYKPPGLFFCQL